MSEKHPSNSSSITFAKIVSGDTVIENNIGTGADENKGSKTETNIPNIHDFNTNLTLKEKKMDSQEDWPSLEVVSNHHCEENDIIGGHKCSAKTTKIGCNSDSDKLEEKEKIKPAEKLTEKDKPVDESSAIAQCLVSPSGGSRKLSKNNWKKVDIEVDYNTAHEVFMSRKLKREPDRRKEFDRGLGPPPRRHHFVNKDRELKRENRDSDLPHTQQHSRSETMHHRQQRSGKIQNEQNRSYRKEETPKGKADAPDGIKKNVEPQMEEEEIVSQASEQNPQNNQQDSAYWYFDDISNGYYYQHSGSQGWKKKNISKQRQQRTVTENNKSSSRHSPNQNHQQQQNSAAIQTDQSNNNKMATMNAQVTQRPIVVVPRSQQFKTTTTGTNRNNAVGGGGNNGGGGGGMRSHHHQNGLRGGGGGGQRQPYNKSGGGRNDGHQRQSGGPDYWRKNGGGNTMGGYSNNNHSSKDEEQRGGGRNNQYYNNNHHQRHNNNNNGDRDRWPRHHPNAPPPLTIEQRRARGPLPDWDEVQEAGGEERFDYMNLMENQYSQYYALAAVPPFDPSLGMMAAAVADPTGGAAAFSAVAPNYIQQLQNRAALASFRPSYIVTAQPPMESLQGVTVAQLPDQQQQPEMIAFPDSNAALLPQSMVATATMPPPPPQTVPPTHAVTSSVAAVLSPNGLIPFPLAAAANPTIQTANIVVSADLHHHQMPTIPTTTTTPSMVVAATQQFPPLQNATTLFTAAAPSPNHRFVPFLDEPKLKELVRGQIEYYFSADNLQKDFFLRRKMDAEGFLPLNLIAGFPRVRGLTLDNGFIIDSLRDSEKIELSEDQQKVRPKMNPLQWPLPESGTQSVPENSPTLSQEKRPQSPKMGQRKNAPAEESKNSFRNEGGKGNSVDTAQTAEQNDGSTKEMIDEKSQIDSSKQNAEQQKGQEDDSNWMEVKTKRNKRNNRGGNWKS